MLSGIDPNYAQATESGLAAFTAQAGTMHGLWIDVEPVEGDHKHIASDAPNLHRADSQLQSFDVCSVRHSRG